MLNTDTKLVVGKGELFFCPFEPGTFSGNGEMYLGNTPGFSISRDVDQVQRFTSYGGKKIARGREIVREVQSAQITTDNIDMENIALWFESTVQVNADAGGSNHTETFTVRKRRYYQIGQSLTGFGVTIVLGDLTFEKDSVDLNADANFTVDLISGRFQVRDDAPDLTDGDEFSVTFSWHATVLTVVNASRYGERVGSLRFISQNPVGPRKNCFFPYVAIRPSGQIDLKGDQWQQMAFDVEIRKLSPTAEFSYVTEYATFNTDELAIIYGGLVSLSEFMELDDELDIIVNIDLPDALT